MKPTDQAKYFNPLSYFIKKQVGKITTDDFSTLNEGI